MLTSSWSERVWRGWSPPVSWSNAAVGADRRPGERRQHRRAGVLVVRRAVLRRQPRTAQAGHSRQSRTRAAGLAGHRGVRPARGPLAAAVGARLRRLRRGGEAQSGCGNAGCRSSRWSAGPSGAATTHADTATRCRASTSPGGPAPRSSRCSHAGCGTPTGSTFAHRHRVDELIVEDGSVVGVRGAVLEPTTPRAGWRRRETSSASSSSARRR